MVEGQTAGAAAWAPGGQGGRGLGRLDQVLGGQDSQSAKPAGTCEVAQPARRVCGLRSSGLDRMHQAPAGPGQGRWGVGRLDQAPRALGD